MQNEKLEYTPAEMDIVAFENEDVISTSGCESYDSEESCVGDI